MKKIYSQPELELLRLTEDVVSTSGTYTFKFTDAGEFTESDNLPTWDW